MRSKTLRRGTTAGALLLLAPVIAHAHPGHGVADGLPGGLVHPFTGWDHVLAMVAVGFLAAQAGGRSRWVLPLSFAAALIVGFAAGAAGFGAPAIEPLLAASVLALGLGICVAARLPGIPSAAVVAVFGLAHGLAHGAEATGAGWTFGAGMLVSALALLSAGVWAHRPFARVAGFAGALVAACGAVLLLG